MLEEVKIPEIEKDTAIFAVREYPDDMLKARAQPWVNDVKDPRFQELIDSLEATMVTNRAQGLAGPQVGIPYRVLTINRGGKPLTMVNPGITKLIGDRVDGNEGCLSFPGLYIKVKRVSSIEVVYLGRDGEQKTETFKGIDARAIQHEIDHLDGVVFVDRIPRVMRSDAMKKWNLAPRKAKQQSARIQELMKRFNAQQVRPAPKKEAAPVT